MKSEKGPNQRNAQEALVDELLSQKIKLFDFIKDLFYLDQSRDDRGESLKNVKIVEDQRVQDFVREVSDEDACHFFNFASLTHLHVFQILISDNEQLPVALKHLEKANEYAQKISDEEYDDWKNYLAALLAYSKGELENLKAICEKMPDKQTESINGSKIESDNENKKVVLDLIAKLEENGKPVYN